MNTQHINLLELTGRNTNLKKVANTRGGEFAGACPKCGGVDRFRVQPETGMWCCRQCHDHWGDAIEYIRWRDGVSFKQAVETLNIPLDKQPFNQRRQDANPNAPRPLDATYAALNDTDWQGKARQFCGYAFDNLWSKDGLAARQYLQKRGISEDTMEYAGLGYNPADCGDEWGVTPIWLPRGIVIPWVINNSIWRVNVRPPVPVNGKKYVQASGGANGLYNADNIKRNSTVVMVEGEFDCLVLQSHVKDVIPVATGTVSWGRITRWVSRLSLADEILLSFDTDTAGESAVAWWLDALNGKAIRYAPKAHDVNDMHMSGQSLAAWLSPYLLSYYSEPNEARLAFRQSVRDEMIQAGYVWRGVPELQGVA